MLAAFIALIPRKL